MSGGAYNRRVGTPRLDRSRIDELASRAQRGEPIGASELGALCDMARGLLEIAPSDELVRLALVVSAARGAVPLDPAQAQALAGAVLKAAEGALVERARGALQEARNALVSGQNWIETLSRMRPGSRLGGQAVGLARSMTKNLHRQLRATGEPLGFGMAAPLEPLDPSEPGYKDVPELAQIARRKCASEVERAHEALRVARLGLLKVARFIHALGAMQETQPWDDALAQRAAVAARDAGAHAAEATVFLG